MEQLANKELNVRNVSNVESILIRVVCRSSKTN